MTTVTEGLSLGPVYEQRSVADSGERPKHRAVSKRAGGAALQANTELRSEEDHQYWANHLEVVQGAQGC